LSEFLKIQLNSYFLFGMKKTLQAGACQVQYEQGALRCLQANGHELVRNIYFALRDSNWGTVPFRIENEQNSVGDDSFLLQFDAVHFLDTQDVFAWKVSIEGTAHHQIVFSIKGRALAPFWRNRAGFCLLHPIKECAGQPLQITQPDGQISDETFPTIIAPHRPFPYIRAMRWWVAGAGEVSVTLEGDEFETEDQRNWGDGSYKTFCTPLAKPFPVELKAGDVVNQKITFVLDSRHSTPQGFKTLVGIHPKTFAQIFKRQMPRIGTLQSYEKTPFTPQEITALRALHLDHLRVEISLDQANWREALRFGYQQALSIGSHLFLALTFGKNPTTQTADFLDFVQKEGIAIADLLLFQNETYATPTALLQEVAASLKAALPHTRLGAGTQTNYTELGRNLFDASMIDFVAYCFQPQEHAFDNQSLMENVESQAYALLSARHHYPQKAIYVSPISFKKRFNPYAQNVTDHFVEQPLSVQQDDRLRTDFGADWLLNTLQVLAEAGAECVTLCRATGALGLVQDEPIAFYEVLQKIQSLQGD
jgi:D-apionolactonase